MVFFTNGDISFFVLKYVFGSFSNEREDIGLAVFNGFGISKFSIVSKKGNALFKKKKTEGDCSHQLKNLF